MEPLLVSSEHDGLILTRKLFSHDLAADSVWHYPVGQPRNLNHPKEPLFLCYIRAIASTSFSIKHVYHIFRMSSQIVELQQ